MPGGMIDKGETPLQGIKRELLEETGFVANVWESLGTFAGNSTRGCGTYNLFFEGCIQTDDTTVSDQGNRYGDQSPVVDVTITTPTRLVTTDSPDTPLDVI